MFWKIKQKLNQIHQMSQDVEQLRYSIGEMETLKVGPGASVREFKVFSQSGEDGVIQWLIHNIPIQSKRFIEFGVQNYTELKTRFLLMHDNWSGLIMDGSQENMDYVKQDNICWMHDLKPVPAFITAENINTLIRDNGFDGEVGILSIDIDGNDYWVWKAISCVQADIVICGYNSRFGSERAVTIPYDPNFYRTEAHSSNLYFGASIRALTLLGQQKGYALVYGNEIGSNLFFIRRELLNDVVYEKTVEECYVRAKYRQARDPQGKLMLLSIEDEEKLLEGLSLVDVSIDF
ncbi:hypothetical protein HMPREF7545_1365 [Selenomonas noxia ATCC 43541]|uniref:hypothetical protein n=1 Tax=Selenomonas noxia TaxID=135083 RepID=UPI0001BCD0A3|nr:hypothetical protein [Selenomonas noxia]EFF65965.1 hypothetical protein HMPREF7545_1365 [Selenomonas noxia ATCC 43541]